MLKEKNAIKSKSEFTKEKIRNRLNSLSVEMLKEIIDKLMDDFRDGSDIVFSMALNVLQSKIDTKSFIEFCDSK